MKRAGPYIATLVIQALCAFFFVSDILSSLVGFRTTPISWEMREALEIGAAFGLILGVVVGGLMLRRALRDRHKAEERLRRASGAFADLLAERFEEWGLTPSEKDVALFAIKGLSTAEIAQLRSTSEGTVKAQTNAIYRKAGVTGRPQLLSLFIEDLMRDNGRIRPMPAPAAADPVPAK
ncbi:helix-turn-helix transcriptional regulator [Rhodobacter calidifons]|uniref:Helix-turn-helix transcriptional regulator n=1 Tax=Rhodobacter calidifons TaxID=2715277 RepID=A0ABX0G4U6_9RHOB|nr:helix-turn-helix transcriptional regulator [Rhodobacter calidifons]NHB76144.1 helix-turn-helix transcriptional regulator [Rhodobacter calidifons]